MNGLQDTRTSDAREQSALDKLLNDLQSISGRLTRINEGTIIRNKNTNLIISKFKGGYPTNSLVDTITHDENQKKEPSRINMLEEIEYQVSCIYNRINEAEELGHINSQIISELNTII